MEMRAWTVAKFGPHRDVLQLNKWPMPNPGKRMAVIKTHALGLNFLDTLAIAGKYQEKSPLPFIPGVEAAGEVVDVGPDSPFQVGDRVMGVGQAAFGEYMVVDSLTGFTIPYEMSYGEAAAFQLTYQTSHVALVHRARLKAGDFLLVHGGAGGVGTSAIQIGKAVGARVIATAGSNEKCEICLNCGAELAINYKDENFVAKVKEITGGHGADVIYDPVGGAVFDDSFSCVAFEGRLVVIGFASGKIPKLYTNRLLLKNVDLVGLYWGQYRMGNPVHIANTQKALYEMYGKAQLDPVIYERFPFENLPHALDAIAEKRSYGKVLVEIL
jgi:NADPH2:quinone reductase